MCFQLKAILLLILHVLIVVDKPQSLGIYFHDSELRILIAVSCQTRRYETTIDDFHASVYWSKVRQMLCMTVPIVLPSDYIGEPINKDIVSGTPIVHIGPRRNMTNYIHKLPMGLSLPQFCLHPLQLVAWVGGIPKQKPILIVARLGIECYNLEIEFVQIDRVEPILPVHVTRILSNPALPGSRQTLI